MPDKKNEDAPVADETPDTLFEGPAAGLTLAELGVLDRPESFSYADGPSKPGRYVLDGDDYRYESL